MFRFIDYMHDEVVNENGKIRKKFETDLDAAVATVKAAARIFGNDWEGFMDATTFAFNGVSWNGSLTMADAHWRFMPGSRADVNFRGYFGEAEDSGYHPDFRDENNQIYHFWVGFATAVQPFDYETYPGSSARVSGVPIISHIGNAVHDNPWFDSAKPKNGNSVVDFALTITAIDIAKQVGPNNVIQNPADLAGVMQNRLGVGEQGGSNGFVDHNSWRWKTPWD
jgi:hypothetical protein